MFQHVDEFRRPHMHTHWIADILCSLGDHRAIYALLQCFTPGQDLYDAENQLEKIYGIHSSLEVLVEKSARIGSINAVYFEIEFKNATLRADAKGRMASSTAAAVRFATEFR